VADSSGTVQARYDYDSYGNATKVSGSIDSDFQYAGYYYHSPSNLNLTLYRAYDPTIARWISRDPIEENGGINLYGYVIGSPVNMVDLDGLTPTPPPFPPPGGGNWKWNPDPNNSRGGSWGPESPTGGGSQPNTTYSQEEGYWKMNDGMGNKSYYNANGNPISKAEAHANWRTLNPKCQPGGQAEPEMGPGVPLVMAAIIGWDAGSALNNAFLNKPAVPSDPDSPTWNDLLGDAYYELY